MSECINLAARFGDTYRIYTDPAVDPSSINDKADSWLMQMHGRFGSVYPYGGDKLVVEVNYHNIIAKRIQQIAGVELHQDGEQEKSFLFAIDLFPQIDELIRLKRKRQVSAEQRATLTARLDAMRPATLQPRRVRSKENIFGASLYEE